MLEQFEARAATLVLTPQSVQALYGLAQGEEGEILFQVDENEFQREFLTVWPIIRDSSLFRQVAQLLAKRLLDMRRKAPFNRIVTCSPTMRYFIEEISFQLRRDQSDLSFEYLGLHPMQGLRLGNIRRFTPRDHVAIISDVVATGRLIEEMGVIVAQTEAKVVGSLSIFATEFSETADKARRFRAAAREDLSPKHPKNALFVARLLPKPETSGDVKPLPIDRSTVYPDVGGFVDTDFSPLLSFTDVLREQRRGSLLSVGTYASNDKWMSLAVDIDRLLRRLRARLEPDIVPAFRLDDADDEMKTRWIVTTPSRDNRVFVDFLVNNLERTGFTCNIIVIPRRESPSEQYSYFAPERVELPASETIFLCLSTVSTSEKLRALAAFLAMSGAKSISVLTLLNRMNAASGSFLSRVLNLQSGKQHGPLLFADVLDPTEFRYSSFFKIHDLSTQDLIRGRQLAQQVVQSYVINSPSVFYVSQAENELKYFEPSSVSSAHFSQDNKLDLSSDEEVAALCDALGLDPASLPESVAYSLCIEHFITEKKTGLLSLLLLTQGSKELTYALVRLVMLNAALLNVRGFFKHLCGKLLSKIGQIELEKRELARREQLLDPDQTAAQFTRCREDISLLVDDQRRCMLILAFVSTLRVAKRDRQHAIIVLKEILSTGNSANDMACIFVTASNPIFLWSLTFFSHAFGILDKVAEAARSCAQVLTKEINGLPTDPAYPSLLDRVRAVHGGSSEQTDDLVNDTAAYVDDLALYFSDDKKVLRYSSHMVVLETLENLLYSEESISHVSAYRYLLRTQQFLTQQMARRATPAPDAFSWLDFEVGGERRHAKLTANSCLMAVNDLVRAAPYIGRLTEISQNYDAWAHYFSTGKTETPFLDDLDRIQGLLLPMRMSYRMPRSDAEEIQIIIERILANIWNPSRKRPQSELYRLVRRYCFRVGDMLERAVAGANSRILHACNFESFWSAEQIEGDITATDQAVFGDPVEVLNAIENALENARHQLGPSPSRDVRRSIRLAKVDHGVRIEIRTLGKAFEQGARNERRMPTWQSQARRLKAFSGDFTYEPIAEPEPGALANIILAKSPFRAVRPATEVEAEGEIL